MVRKHAERGSVLPAVWVFVSGYLLVWAGFSLAAALVQAGLEHAALLTPMMESASKWLNGALLVAAGAYQLTPLKDLCLSKCRNPVQFFMTHWRPGTAGALRMGVTHGAYCVGCCWVLMLLLFAVGVMNLAWVAVIAAFVLLEKLLPAGRLVSRLAGAALIALGLAVLAFAA
jgi:predicted metal-binding membrane protein